jgi:hypothetical protein
MDKLTRERLSQPFFLAGVRLGGFLGGSLAFLFALSVGSISFLGPPPSVWECLRVAMIFAVWGAVIGGAFFGLFWGLLGLIVDMCRYLSSTKNTLRDSERPALTGNEEWRLLSKGLHRDERIR